jgi:hypothetical protein
VLKGIAERHSASIPQIAIGWLLAEQAVTSAFVGAKNLAQLDDNLKASTALSVDERRGLDEVSRLTPEYSGWMLAAPTDRTPGQSRRFWRPSPDVSPGGPAVAGTKVRRRAARVLLSVMGVPCSRGERRTPDRAR